MSTFNLKVYSIPQNPFGIQSFTLKPAMMHTAIICCFSAIMAPFSGLFFKGLKRALRIRVFGNLAFPGEQGVMDRGDTHYVVGMFVFVYCTQVIFRSQACLAWVKFYLEQMTQEDQLKIYQTLLKDLGEQAQSALS